MDTIIVYRNPNSGRVGIITDDDGEPYVFPHMDDAIAATDRIPVLQAFHYQIVELDEL